ncbi:hypothetical protein AYO40_06850 [Planctomycetaceae bacterium SCGC AG-212-D15]|nr:hypothetical protein AYO40_06850 [Planctomycetaceae bacterium SCGC AG-212-D15]
MDRLKPLVDFLKSIGVEQVAHTHKTYMGHLVNLYRLMESKGFSEELCRAGMFHSIYGTERFQGFKLPVDRRAEVRELIGERAEYLAYLNCAIDRTVFDRVVASGKPPYRILDRLTGKEVELSADDFNDLCRIHFYDYMEQVGRSQTWEYRRAGYRALAERLGKEAREMYDEIFAAEKAAAS